MSSFQTYSELKYAKRMLDYYSDLYYQNLVNDEDPTDQLLINCVFWKKKCTELRNYLKHINLDYRIYYNNFEPDSIYCVF